MICQRFTVLPRLPLLSLLPPLFKSLTFFPFPSLVELGDTQPGVMLFISFVPGHKGNFTGMANGSADNIWSEVNNMTIREYNCSSLRRWMRQRRWETLPGGCVRLLYG